MRPVGVVGAGTMGCGIAQCLAEAGRAVVVVDNDAAALDRAAKTLKDAVRQSVLLGRSSRNMIAAVSERIHWASAIDELAPVDAVIEAVTERTAIKTEVFTELDRICTEATVLASCTSSVPIAHVAAATRRPERVLGLHVMNPAPLTGTVEVVNGMQTAPDVLETALELVQTMGKRGIVVGDRPGFVLNRVLMLSIAEAAVAVADGVSAETVDALFEGCLNHSTGPLRTADLIGLDNVVDTMTVLRAELGDDRYTVPTELAALVAAGHFGRKTGRGFHVYA